MKRIFVLLAIFALTACGGESTTTEPVADAPEPAAEAAAPQVPAMVEFVWHQKADGFTDEALQSPPVLGQGCKRGGLGSNGGGGHDTALRRRRV